MSPLRCIAPEGRRRVSRWMAEGSEGRVSATRSSVLLDCEGGGGPSRRVPVTHFDIQLFVVRQRRVLRSSERLRTGLRKR